MDPNEIPQMSMWIEGKLVNDNVLMWNEVRGMESTLSSVSTNTCVDIVYGQTTQCHILFSHAKFVLICVR